MIKCETCKIEILSPGTECPLCHAPLDIPTEDDTRESDFPQRGYVRSLAVYKIDKFFLLISFLLSILFLIIEYFFTDGVIKFAWIPMSVSLDVFYWLKIHHHIQKYISHDIVIHALGFSFIALSLWLVLPDPKIIFEYLVPIIKLLASIAMAIYAIKNIRSPKKFIMPCLFLGILSLIPLIVSFSLEINNYFLPAFVAGIGVLGIASILIFALARVGWEIKKLFHN